MKSFITEDFLLSTGAARRLYHTYAENMPVFDYHCHLSPREIYEDRRFADIGEAWLAGDHYKWRLMRANGVHEEYVTGNAGYREKFFRFAEILPGLVGNPVYHWCQLELERYFGTGVLLDAGTAERVWQQANEVLQSEGGSARALILRSGVRALCTTDDPADDLRYHRLLAEEGDFPVRVLPTFRPEKALSIMEAGFAAYAEQLGTAAGTAIRSLGDMKEALSRRAAYFARWGCRASDHSFGSPDFTVWDEKAAEQALQNALAGRPVSRREADAYCTVMMEHLGAEYSRHGFVMQLHMGVQRNLSTRLLHLAGPDAGGDAVGDTVSAVSVAALLDRLQLHGSLPRTILYPLNAADNDKLASIAGCFQDESCPGKLQLGPAWWFNDHLDGMNAQLRSLAAIGVLGRFTGMLTDSRSFLSYPRHEYFRRILCELLGGWVERGLAPDDIDALGGMVQDICFRNAWAYFGMEDGEGIG